MSYSKFALALGLLIPAVASADTTFDGYFAFDTPGSNFTDNGTSGNWTVGIDYGSGSANVDTSLAPDSVSLSANAEFIGVGNALFPARKLPGLQGNSGAPATASVQILSPGTGTFTLNYNLSGLGGPQAFAFDPNGAHPLVFGPGTVVLALVPGQNITIQVVANPTALTGFTTSTLVLSNPILNLTPVPEASTVAAGLALAGMGAWSWARSRKRA